MSNNIEDLFHHIDDAINGPCWYCQLRDPRPSGLCDECAAWLRGDSSAEPEKAHTRTRLGYGQDAQTVTFRTNEEVVIEALNRLFEALVPALRAFVEALTAIGRQADLNELELRMRIPPLHIAPLPEPRIPKLPNVKEIHIGDKPVIYRPDQG